MKHLKKFNESNVNNGIAKAGNIGKITNLRLPIIKRQLSEDEINDIKDVFQDVIDEHDLVYDPNWRIASEDISGIKTYEYETINKGFKIHTYLNTKRAPQLLNDLRNKFVPRLKNMGFNVYLDDYSNGPEIEIHAIE